VALFNTGDAAAQLSIDFAQAGIKGKAMVRDLWAQKDMGIFKNSYRQQVNSHGALLLRIAGK
jgi:alpha-galactosidase